VSLWRNQDGPGGLRLSLGGAYASAQSESHRTFTLPGSHVSETSANDEPRQVILGQPLGHARRHQELLIAIAHSVVV
jgi:hypothetical protein